MLSPVKAPLGRAASWLWDKMSLPRDVRLTKMPSGRVAKLFLLRSSSRRCGMASKRQHGSSVMWFESRVSSFNLFKPKKPWSGRVPMRLLSKRSFSR